MVRQGLIASFLFLLGQVVQEEVEQNGVDPCIGLNLEDLPPEQLNRPYAAA